MGVKSSMGQIKKALGAALALLSLLTAPAWAGEVVRVECTRPPCQYTRELLLGGARHSPAITCYCAKCRDFVRLKLKNWGEYHQESYRCPQCGGPATPVYGPEDISAFPCPQCGQRSLRARTTKLFD